MTNLIKKNDAKVYYQLLLTFAYKYCMHIIDSHQHFWKYNEADYDWIDDSMPALKQDFFPNDLKPIYEHNGIDACIAVQALSSEVETNTLLKLATDHDFIKGVVGWVDLCNPNVLQRLEYYARFEKFKGVRMVLQGEEDGFMEQSTFLHGMNLLAPLNLTYDILIYPKHLFTAYHLAKKFPQQKFIIDHLAKPAIRQHQFDNWSELMANFHDLPNVYCKISGMVTEADWKKWQYTDFTPALDTVTEVFGADRLMYGSDWPVCLLAGSYKNVLDIAKTYFGEFSAEQQKKIFYKNAIQFYNLDVSWI